MGETTFTFNPLIRFARRLNQNGIDREEA